MRKRTDKKRQYKFVIMMGIITAIYLFGAVSGTSFAEAIRTWNPKNYHHYHTPDIAVKRKGGSTFYRDPFVWAYTSKFAKRYGMPEEWIDDSLKGAEAIAFRHMPNNAVQCGFFRNKDACRVDIKCQLDLYIPKSANLPWIDDRKQGFHPRHAFRSMRYLVKQKQEELLVYDAKMPNHFNRFGAKSGIQSMRFGIYKHENISLALGRQPKKISGYYGNGSANIREFDRSFLTNIDYLSTGIGCRHAEEEKGIPVISIGDYIIRNGKELSRHPHPQVHQIVIPRAYWDRVNLFQKKNYRKKDSFSQFVIDRLQGNQQ